jgi:pimeloyl-ACP methyl ester carboxylesterase
MNRAIYCISGMGADEKAFINLQVNGYELKFIPWIRPHKNERIEHYAERMAKYIKHDSPILLGLSFGGMVSIEIAKQMPVKKIFIVSSIKSYSELPGWMKVAATLKLHKLLPTRSYKIMDKIDNRRLGVSNKEERDMVNAYRKNADPDHINWSIHQVMNWKNNWQPDNIIHIHGDKDKIFPIKKIKPTHVIKDGTHMMIYNRAKDVSAFIERELGVDK